MTTMEQLQEAREACRALARASAEEKNRALLAMAEALERQEAEILCENVRDLDAARGTISEVMLDRLSLNATRIAAMADGLRQVAALPDPVGRVLKDTERADGLHIRKVAVPLGVVAIIYESRPNVTADAAALAIKSGNVCVLRGGKEAHRSNAAIVAALKSGLENAGVTPELLHLIEDTTRAGAQEMMTASGLIDLLIPRGGAGLIRACVENATVPCIQTGTGICHVYVEKSADLNMALRVIENAKKSRPSVCNAEEVCLVDAAIAPQFLPMLKARLSEGDHPVELRLDATAGKIIDGIPAGDRDFDTEFLDYILAVGVVADVDAAIAHIRQHSTGHSDAILSRDEEAIRKFTTQVDSAAVYVNASTRFTDGGEFGLGCEMGISTQKLHARGPMGLEELTTYKYIVVGNGNVR